MSLRSHTIRALPDWRPRTRRTEEDRGAEITRHGRAGRCDMQFQRAAGIARIIGEVTGAPSTASKAKQERREGELLNQETA